MSDLQAKWDAIYSQNPQTAIAASVLSEHRYLLPHQGRALDLACGLGGNALLLAGQGLRVDAWDISLKALDILQNLAISQQLAIQTRPCLITPKELAHSAYDVIVISRFLDRTLCNAIMASLKPEGLLFYQTFTLNKVDQQGPSNPDYLLEANELLRLFAPLRLVYYQEYARIGDRHIGNRNEACFIGQKTNR